MTDRGRDIKRINFLIAGGVADLLAVTVPVIYFLLSYQFLSGSLETESEINAGLVTNLVNANPKLWRFEDVRLKGLLGKRLEEGHSDSWRIFDLKGAVIAESDDAVALLSIRSSDKIRDSGIPIARLEVYKSLFPVLATTGLLAVLYFLGGGVTFLMLRTVPLRAVEESQRSLAASERKYRSLYENMWEGMVLYEAISPTAGGEVELVVVDINPAAAALLGGTPAELTGKNAHELFGSDLTDRLRLGLTVGTQHNFSSCEVTLDQGMVLSVSLFAPEPGKVATLLENITDRKRAEARIHQLAYYDDLTGLPNRLLLLDRLHQALAQATRTGEIVAILFFDLDRFKTINDTMGHDMGDRLLIKVAERLQSSVRKSDTVCRLGGDEFVLIVTTREGERNVSHIANELLARLSEPFPVDDRQLFTATSIGIAIYPVDGQDPSTLLKHADMAMYSAKDAGRNNFRFFSHELDLHAHERLEMETSLRNACQRKELFLLYQPQVDCQERRLIGVEALLRWNHPEKGIIPPGQFLPIAEETGQILCIGEWVLRTACRQSRAFQDAGFGPLRVAVNLSSRQFERSSLVEMVANILAETGLAPECLELELTEGTLMRNSAEASRTLGQLKELGVKLAIDDFGTGYSSLGSLKIFPIDRIKIDRSFIGGASRSPEDASIVEAIIAMARSLHLDIIAEGVETEEQLRFLCDRFCGSIQGYYLYYPLSVEMLTDLLQRGVSPPLGRWPTCQKPQTGSAERPSAMN